MRFDSCLPYIVREPWKIHRKITVSSGFPCLFFTFFTLKTLLKDGAPLRNWKISVESNRLPPGCRFPKCVSTGFLGWGRLARFFTMDFMWFPLNTQWFPYEWPESMCSNNVASQSLNFLWYVIGGFAEIFRSIFTPLLAAYHDPIWLAYIFQLGGSTIMTFHWILIGSAYGILT